MTTRLELPQPTTSAREHDRSRLDAILGWIQSHPARFLLLVFMIVAVALVLKPAVKGTLGMPPAPRDATAYENIGFNLAHGRGFRFDWDNPEWRALYEQHNSDHRYDYLKSRSGSWLTASRPPMLPLLIAGNHLLFGRQFVTIRISNAILIAAAVCLAAALAMRLIGPLGAVLVPMLAMADRRMLTFSEAILTESLALLTVVLLTWLLARLLDRPSARNAVLAGATLGFSLLCRSIFILWYPLLAVTVFLLVRNTEGSRITRRALMLTALFLAAAVAVPTPWWVRNCIVLDAFMPLGTQGGIALAAGYSDAAWRSGRGDSIIPRTWGFFDPLERSGAYLSLPGHLQERERARLGARHSAEWIKQNLEKLPVLAWRRLRSLMRPRSAYEVALLALAFGGLLLSWRHPLALLLAALVAINALTVMGMLATGGRYLMPISGSLYVLAAVGLVGVGRWLTAKITRGQANA